MTQSNQPSNLVNMLREMTNPQRIDESQRNPVPLLLKAADEIERLDSVATAEMKLREGNFATIERLTAQDEVHWKTRRSLLADIERLRAALGQINDECISAGLIARMALNGEDPVAAARIARGAGETPLKHSSMDYGGGPFDKDGNEGPT